MKLTDRQWAAAIVLSIMLIGALVLIGVGLSQPTPQEQLISDLRTQDIPVKDERALIAVIDDTCPYIDTSYRGVRNLESLGLTEDQALDTLAVVRYSEYCS